MKTFVTMESRLRTALEAMRIYDPVLEMLRSWRPEHDADIAFVKAMIGGDADVPAVIKDQVGNSSFCWRSWRLGRPSALILIREELQAELLVPILAHEMGHLICPIDAGPEATLVSEITAWQWAEWFLDELGLPPIPFRALEECLGAYVQDGAIERHLEWHLGPNWLEMGEEHVASFLRGQPWSEWLESRLGWRPEEWARSRFRIERLIKLCREGRR